MSNTDFKEVFAENIKVFYDKLQDKMHPLPVRMQTIKDDEVVFTGISVDLGDLQPNQLLDSY